MLDLKNKTKPVAQGHKIVAAGSYGALSYVPRFLWGGLIKPVSRARGAMTGLRRP